MEYEIYFEVCIADMNDYFDDPEGEAITKLLWSGASTAKSIVPQSQLFPPMSGSRVMDNKLAQQQSLPQKNDLVLAFTTAGISPNPVKSGQAARLQINSSRAGAVVLSVIGNNGATISNRRISLVKGINTISVNTFSLAQGWYLIRIEGSTRPVLLKLVVN